MFIQGKGPPLLVASYLGYEDIADLLMKNGADPDKEDEVCAVTGSCFHLPVSHREVSQPLK